MSPSSINHELSSTPPDSFVETQATADLAKESDCLNSLMPEFTAAGSWRDPDKTTSPWCGLSDAEGAVLFQRCLERLPPMHRASALADSAADVAVLSKRWGVGEPAVRHARHHARKALVTLAQQLRWELSARSEPQAVVAASAVNTDQ